MQDDPLSQLRDIHMPTDPSWWPPAPGWWLLAVLVLAGVGLLVWWLAARWQQARPRRLALANLERLHQAYAGGEIDPNDYVHQLNALLKRFWVRALGRYDLAPLTGKRWLAQLDSLSDSRAFTEGAGQVLGNTRFSKAPMEIEPGLDRLVEALVRNTSMRP